LRGSNGDAINAALSAAGYNLRWLLRAVACGMIKPFYCVQILWQLIRGIRHGLGSAAQKEHNNVRNGAWCLGHPAGFMRLVAAR
jgi:IS5 family transposase